MEIIKRLIVDFEIDFNIEEKVDKVKLYYKEKIKGEENKLQHLYDIYEKEIENLIFDTSIKKELEDYTDVNIQLFDNQQKPIIELGIIKECHIEALKQLIENLKTSKSVQDDIAEYSKDYEYYPDYYDSKMIEKITHKKEFHLHRLKNDKKELEDLCDTSFFEIQSHQYFLKNLMSKNTHYNGILIFHGVGVGKTCSGVSIAENFKDIYGEDDKKIMILSSKNIQIGWKKTIFNPHLKDNQCTGDTYSIDDNVSDVDKESKRVVKKYYDFYGYASFANMIKRLIERNCMIIEDDELRIKKEIELIKETFSDRILIIDEVHNIRNDGDGEKVDRDTLIYIEKMIKYSDNLKLILLTANPMFNKSNEIVWILNLLLMNDKKELIDEKTTFKNDIVTEYGEKILKEKSKGYISYLRGENPISFPIRRYPKKRSYPHVKIDKVSSSNSQKINLFQTGRIQDKISFLELYTSELNDYQKKYYLLQSDTYKDEEKLRIEDEGYLLQLSNICYPNTSEDIKEKIGDEGFNSCFSLRKGLNQYSYKLNTLNKYKEFLKEEYIWKYSSKIYTILQEIKHSDGIIFIYTNYLKSGVIPLALALEQNGYLRYNESPLLNHKNKSSISYEGKLREDYKNKNEFIQGKYMIISGGSLTKNLEEKLRVLTSRGNKDGEKIKIVIGSSVAAEGLDFKNIRNVHILEPWHNLNKLEQVNGRAIRNCSHKDLSKEKRNVTIYLHSSNIDVNRETIEMYLYRIAEKKAKDIGKIETILKQNAIDRELFRSMNILSEKDVNKIPIQMAYRDEKKIWFKEKKVLIDEYYEPYDRSYSRACSFQPTCDYLKDIKIVKRDINNDTFTTLYLQSYLNVYKKRISLLFKEYYSLTLENMYDLIEKYQEIESQVLYQALEEMIVDRYTIVSGNGDLGYLTYQNKCYLFQPYFNEDKTLPLYYRLNNGLTKKEVYIVPKMKIEKIELPERYTYQIEDVNNFISDKIISFDQLRKKEVDTDKKIDLSVILEVFDYFKDNNLSYDKNEIDQLKYEYLLERYSFDDKITILYLLLSQLKSDTKYKIANEINEMLFEKYSKLLLYYDRGKSRYYYLTEYNEKNKDDLFGGFIYYYPEKKPIFFKYKIDGLERCNKIEEYDILRSLKKYNRIDILSFRNNWCYLYYSKRWDRFMNNMILKVISSSNKDKPKDTFPPGEGVIIMDPVPGWYINNMLDFIQDKDGLYLIYSKLNEKQKEKINEKSKNRGRNKERVNLFLSTFIEISMRINKTCVHPDIIWLRYIK